MDYKQPKRSISNRIKMDDNCEITKKVTGDGAMFESCSLLVVQSLDLFEQIKCLPVAFHSLSAQVSCFEFSK